MSEGEQRLTRPAAFSLDAGLVVDFGGLRKVSPLVHPLLALPAFEQLAHRSFAIRVSKSLVCSCWSQDGLCSLLIPRRRGRIHKSR
mmetsp:Transcript_33428/g.77123  ORF Transcript_33428/g.77123 Transcript_33428/m.77123 type:complete len:86 (-) Transcript_33428:67-324(-)